MGALSQMESDGPQADTGKVAGVAAVVTTSGAVLACAACCVLPIAIPAVAVGGGGAVLALFSAVSPVLTVVGVALVALAWLWVALATRKTGKRPARLTVTLLSISTLLAALAVMWPAIEPSLLGLIR